MAALNRPSATALNANNESSQGSAPPTSSTNNHAEPTNGVPGQCSHCRKIYNWKEVKEWLMSRYPKGPPSQNYPTYCPGNGLVCVSQRRDREEIWQAQIEQTRMHLEDILNDPDEEDEQLKEFTWVLRTIIQHWQELSDNRRTTYHAVKFGAGLSVTLLQIFALIPEHFQHMIKVRDANRTPVNGSAMSWLDESVMNVLVDLLTAGKNPRFEFRPLLTWMATISYDNHPMFGNKPYLEHLESQMKEDRPASIWNPANIFSFNDSIEKIVFLWNYTEGHWVVIESTIHCDGWAHELFDSQGGTKLFLGPTSYQTAVQMPTLERLIRGASDIATPGHASEFSVGKSCLQTNSADCGVIAVYNAVELLHGYAPSINLGSKEVEQLRLDYMKTILGWLDLNTIGHAEDTGPGAPSNDAPSNDRPSNGGPSNDFPVSREDDFTFSDAELEAQISALIFYEEIKLHGGAGDQV